MAQSAARALKHILIILLAEQPSTDSSTMPALLKPVLPMHQIEPDAYGSISSLSLAKGGDEDHQLNIIQVKQIDSLFSWWYQQHSITSPMIIRWFNLHDTTFQAWHTLPSIPIPAGAMASYPPGGIPTSSSAIYGFCKSVNHIISEYNTFKEDDIIIFLPLLRVIMLITYSA
jgi:hypothetical protein